ncbi:hypothetical protein OC844_005646 [Tilletia horrida]|nr:hypothetical protein OC844_005646 [Tilletia horrida]
MPEKMEPAHKQTQKQDAQAGSGTATAHSPPVTTPTPVQAGPSAFDVGPVHELVLAECELAQAFRHYKEVTGRMGLLPNWRQVVRRHVGLAGDEQQSFSPAGSGASVAMPSVGAQAEQDLYPHTHPAQASLPSGSARAPALGAPASSASPRAWPSIEKSGSEGGSPFFCPAPRTSSASTSAAVLATLTSELARQAPPTAPQLTLPQRVDLALLAPEPQVDSPVRHGDTAEDKNGAPNFVQGSNGNWQHQNPRHWIKWMAQEGTIEYCPGGSFTERHSLKASSASWPKLRKLWTRFDA